MRCKLVAIYVAIFLVLGVSAVDAARVTTVSFAVDNGSTTSWDGAVTIWRDGSGGLLDGVWRTSGTFEVGEGVTFTSSTLNLGENDTTDDTINFGGGPTDGGASLYWDETGDKLVTTATLDITTLDVGSADIDTATGNLASFDAMTVNNAQGAVGDFIAKGASEDNLLHVDASADQIFFGDGDAVLYADGSTSFTTTTVNGGLRIDTLDPAVIGQVWRAAETDGTGEWATLATAGIFYMHSTASTDITGYAQLEEQPSDHGESTTSTAVTSGGGEAALEQWVTEEGTPTVEVIGAGRWAFEISASVDNDTGVTQVKAYVYKRAVGGSETLLFNTTSGEINGSSAASYQWNYIISTPITLLLTDRIVIKWVALTTSNPSRTVTIYLEGTANASHFHTTIASGVTFEVDPVYLLDKDNVTSLSDNSVVDGLHRHSELVAPDGAPDPVVKVNNAGLVGIGTTTQDEEFVVTAEETTVVVAIDSYGTAAGNISRISMRRSRDTSIDGKVETEDGDILGDIAFFGVDTGSNREIAGVIKVVQDGAAGSRVPGRIEIKLATSSAANALTFVISLNAIAVGVDDAVDDTIALGAGTIVWDESDAEFDIDSIVSIGPAVFIVDPNTAAAGANAPTLVTAVAKAGGNTGAGADAGDGGGYSYTAGVGGDQGLGAGDWDGGDGGAIALTTGVGGDVTNGGNAGDGGDGGAFSITLGTGGTAAGAGAAGSTGRLNISGLPTTTTGLNTGDIWLNSNVLTIIP